MRRILKTLLVICDDNNGAGIEQPLAVQVLGPELSNDGVISRQPVVMIEDADGKRWYVSAKAIHKAIAQWQEETFLSR